MITPFFVSKKNKTESLWLLDFLSTTRDLYFTENNQRIFITDYSSLKKLFTKSSRVYTLQKNGIYVGLILVWKSKGEINRHYVKMVAKNNSVARDLLTVLTWNFNRELFVRIDRSSPLVGVYKSKGFRYASGDKGSSILLRREPIVYQNKFFSKEEEE